MKSVQNIVLFLSILLLIGLMYISYFNVYQTDDYIYSYGTQKLGVVNNIKDFYLNWGGRYFGYSFNTLNPIYYDKEGILPKIYPIFLILSFIGISILNFKQYFKYTFKEATIKSFILFFFYTLLLVSIPEHFFWITGANIYFLPVILFGFLLYFIGKYIESRRKKWFYLSIVLIFILMGSNEILALILLGLLLVFNQKSTKESKFLLMLGLLFCLISFLAPGNFKRLDSSTDNILIKWIKRVGIFGVNNIYVFIKTMLLIPLFIKVFENELNTIIKKVNFKKAFMIWGVCFIPFVFTAYITNSIARQFENLIFFYFISISVLWFLKFEKIKRYWWISVVVIFLPRTSFFLQKYSNFNIDFNLNNLGKEILYTDLKKYDQEIEDRINTIKNSKKDSIVLYKIKNVPKVLYFDEMSSVKEEKKYVNVQLQKYFNKKYIRVKD